MSNGESKIAESKAALCCGFAIALRALFLVIRRCDFSRTHCVIARSVSLVAIKRVKRSWTFDCFALLAMTNS